MTQHGKKKSLLMKGVLKRVQKCVGVSLIMQLYRALVKPRARRTALLRFTGGGVERRAPVPLGKPSGFVHTAHPVPTCFASREKPQKKNCTASLIKSFELRLIYKSESRRQCVIIDVNICLFKKKHLMGCTSKCIKQMKRHILDLIHCSKILACKEG